MKAFTTVGQAAKNFFEVRLPQTIGATMPSLLLIVLLPISLAGLADRRRGVFWLMSWCYLAGAACFYIFLGHYTIAAAPAVIFALLLGANQLEAAFPQRNGLKIFLPLAIAGLAGQCIAQNQQHVFEPFHPTVTQANYFMIPDRVQKPAIVLFRMGPHEEAWEEPVYNWDVLWPDEAPIIRAT